MQQILMRASRVNFRQCTGPRSPEGKKRVAQNALRHGLARAIASDEHWSEPVRLLMDAIVGGDRDEKRLCLARAIAGPAMEVIRVRRARQALLDVASLPQRDAIQWDPELNPDPVDEQENREAAIAEVVLKLSALDRYERRALSRRKFAIRDWDDYGRKRNEADCAIDSPSQEIDPNAV
jgi:hypothetical protein